APSQRPKSRAEAAWPALRGRRRGPRSTQTTELLSTRPRVVVVDSSDLVPDSPTVTAKWLASLEAKYNGKRVRVSGTIAVAPDPAHPKGQRTRTVLLVRVEKNGRVSQQPILLLGRVPPVPGESVTVEGHARIDVKASRVFRVSGAEVARWTV